MAVPATPLIFLDGGLGTTLEEEHAVRFTSSTTPLWSSHLLLTPSGQATLRRCQGDFVRAGAGILLTATYQVSIEGFERTRTDQSPDGVPRADIPEFLNAAISIAEDTASASEDAGRGKAKIALSLGPYGACMIPSQEYSGKYDAEHNDEESLFTWHAERLALFEQVSGLAGRINYVAFETVPRYDEIRAIRRAFATSTLKGKPFWISAVYPGEDPTPRALADGTPVTDVVMAMLDLRVSDAVPWAVGINCTGIEKLRALVKPYEAVVKHLRNLERRPALVLCPNGTSDEVYDSTTQKWQKSGLYDSDEVS
jgi:homocysteine S-methyltransferase